MDSIPNTPDTTGAPHRGEARSVERVGPERFDPVTSELGERVRQIGIHHVSQRYLELTDRAKRRQLTGVERLEVSSCERVLETLQRMAPIGELQPARVRGQLALPVPV